ncbi:lysophospholipid acyltransferase family protein [Prolixibacteraceae bacterium Z1-6]|uniref:Lysophospholipid acyltransferase family protein n=1 Tax=Draconibacterium aestuarii TaxID=2998507 RepID=A0A9X3F653_9BACT|nr:lysophospholipid acyltransferase family protein [Prolixibacteraceae bacterium Z1-6]
MTERITKTDKSAKLFSNFRNNLIVIFLKGISFLPFRIIYALSDLIYFLNKYILKYRYRVTTENLKAAFPQKTEEEITQLRNKFYHRLFDFLTESVKLYSMSAKEMAKRMDYSGLQELEDITAKREGAIVLAFHYNNWEWCSYTQAVFKHPILMVYNPPRNNSPMENFLKNSRGKWGGVVTPTTKAARSIFDYKQKGEPAVLWLAADQTGHATSPFWMNFLNREASFFTGPEKIAAKTKYPVFFQYVKCVGRGRYKVDISMLAEHPEEMKANEILIAYVEKMEAIIREEPEHYLWSHRRWKHTRPGGVELIR